MAEPVVFGGSPLDQYLRDADQTEQQAPVIESSSVTESEAQPPATRPEANSTDNSFIEKFKYVICSSFLLAPSLSISLYESDPPFPTQHTAKEDRDVKRKRASANTRGRINVASPIRRHGHVTPADATSGAIQRLDALIHERIPRLDTQGRLACNVVCFSALLLLPPISRSWRLWLATLVLIVCLALGFLVLFEHASFDDSIEFTLLRHVSASATTSAKSLRRLPTTSEYSSSEKKALQRAVLKDVSSLIKAAQSFDISVNKAISAVQEVEIVSRGYKITHPLPPISRIEAASGWSRVASPNRPRRSLNGSSAPTNGKLARSLSGGGNGAPTVRRQGHRPLSLNLSNGRMSPLDRPSGRMSPAVSSEAGDLELTQRILVEQSTAALAAGRQAPQRLVELRKGIIAALEEVGAFCTSSTASLEMLTDAEELALLHDLYALDASSQDDTDADADASHVWSNGDAPALSLGSPDPGYDRTAWAATTPRKSGRDVRSAGLSSSTDAAWRTESSPQTGPVNHKRLSLMSDGGSILDRQPRASSSLSRRSSLVSESGLMGTFRSPRLNYVSDKSTAASGPNESAAAKRLSYVSTSNSSLTASSFDARSPAMRNASTLSSHFTPPHSSMQNYSAATSPQSRATKHASILGPNSVFAPMDASLFDLSSSEPNRQLSLLSIKAKFEWMHRARRRWLCHLLALQLDMSGQVRLASNVSLPCDEYWSAARSTIESVTSTLLEKTETITATVAKEMGPDSLHTSKGGATTTQQKESLMVPHGKTDMISLVGHPGIEDRLHAMMLSLRSLQSKIRVCAEDIHVKSIPGLHGLDDETCTQSRQALGRHDDDDDAVMILQLETTLESMRDDFVGLSAEWEATIKLIHKEKRRSPSPQPSTDFEADVSKSNAARDLESPLEADEDAARSATGNEDDDDDLLSARRRSQEAHLDQPSDDEDDGDLAALLLRSTSPHSLPPPGLEQVFESIAGMAGLSGLTTDGRKLNRAERIEQTRRQRQEQQERQASETASHRHSMDPSGMMTELNDVISSRKAIRDQRHQSALPLAATMTGALATQSGPTPSGTAAPPALVLGSPLDLGPAEQDGVFDASHSFSSAKALPRRSLSSLDLARARALQALEARSSSTASSSTSNSFDSGDESMLSVCDDFSFEPTALESVPEDAAATTASVLPTESPSTPWDSTSRKSTPKASQTPLFSSDATPVPESPFDLGAQVAAYARRKKAAKAQAAAMQASGSEGSMSSVPSQ